MSLLDISIQSRVIIGISAMVLLFSSFLIAFITNQRKKLQYHKNLQAIHEEQQQVLMQTNLQLEDRVKQRTVELSQQKENLQTALTDLKASQLQLVQKEKMASLGEVASGIAHEIQNPLNFVNNFAEVSTELLEEMHELVQKESLSGSDKEEIKDLLDDVTQNLRKINMHGKRADNIVKNMLQHARNSGSEKVLTDINFLAEEYLKLSYHGFRSKEKNLPGAILSVHVAVQSNLDSTIDTINIVSQDIGQVLMNIYNNAFYSVYEKSRKGLPDYAPKVTVTTAKEGNTVKVTVRDNGVGIAEKYIGKILQPFFTTKPTGVGTGLGLSLSYEIVKAHRGELKVKSVEGEYAEFEMELPVD